MTRNQTLPPQKFYQGPTQEVPRSLPEIAGRDLPMQASTEQTFADARQEALKPPRFDLDRLDWSRVDELLAEPALAYKTVRQHRYDAENYAMVPIPDSMKRLWSEQEEAAKLLADPEEIGVVDAYFADSGNGNIRPGSRLSFRTKGSADAELFGRGLKARVLPE